MFRFTIRDLLWLTVVVGICLTWAADRAIVTRRDELIRQHNKSLDELAKYWKAESEKERRGVEHMREVFRKNRLTDSKVQ